MTQNIDGNYGLEPFDADRFLFRPYQSSKAARGFCSYCRGERKAYFMLNVGHKGAKGYCRIHARLYQLRRMMEDTRQAFEFAEDQEETVLRLVAG